MSMNTGKRRQVFNEINITPLTDIFLVLLIIMMVVAPMLNTTGLKVSVPTIGPSADQKEQPKTIALDINADGRYYIDQRQVDPALLANEFRNLKSQKPDGIVIKTSPDASHGSLTYAMDAAEEAGISKLAVTAANKEPAHL